MQKSYIAWKCPSIGAGVMFHVKVLYPFIEWKMIQSYSVFHCKKDEKPDKEN